MWMLAFGNLDINDMVLFGLFYGWVGWCARVDQFFLTTTGAFKILFAEIAEGKLRRFTQMVDKV